MPGRTTVPPMSSLYPYADRFPVNRGLPQQGRSRDSILEELREPLGHRRGVLRGDAVVVLRDAQRVGLGGVQRVLGEVGPLLLPAVLEPHDPRHLGQLVAGVVQAGRLGVDEDEPLAGCGVVREVVGGHGLPGVAAGVWNCADRSDLTIASGPVVPARDGAASSVTVRPVPTVGCAAVPAATALERGASLDRDRRRTSVRKHRDTEQVFG